jgi:type II secretory pathway pseudopilin PulG
MNLKNITRIILGILAIFLAYFLFESIMKPQRFETLRSRKETEVVNRLKDIRTAQLAYRSVHGRFIGSLDSLVMFLEDGKLPTVRKTGEIPDSLSEAQALKLGIISRDTVFSDAYSVLFPNNTDKQNHLAALKYIPFTNRTKEFRIEAGLTLKNNLSVPVIEVSAHLFDYMNEPEYKQLVFNAAKRASDMNRFPGRKFGSMLDPQTEGNWE